MNIEFRAFDIKEKVLCKVQTINFDKGCFLLGNSPTEGYVSSDRSYNVGDRRGHFVNFEDLELMQYTKEKDADGNKLFENDIIEYYGCLYIIIHGKVYDLESYLDDDYDGKFGSSHGDYLVEFRNNQIKLISNKYEYNG